MYISSDKTTRTIDRPVKELKGFEKVYLEPGETSRVELTIDGSSIAFWDQEMHHWVSEKGCYEVLIGTSSAQIALRGALKVEKTTTWTGLIPNAQ